jgi:hypothetical protein
VLGGMYNAVPPPKFPLCAIDSKKIEVRSVFVLLFHVRNYLSN